MWCMLFKDDIVFIIRIGINYKLKSWRKTKGFKLGNFGFRTAVLTKLGKGAQPLKH